MSEYDSKNIIELSFSQDQLQPTHESENLQQGWWSSTANWMKKKYFNGAHLLDLALNDEKSDDIALFGMKFKSNEQARDFYKTVLWFTYRENLKFYKIKREFTIKSDVGWGCMIRVGQMMLAHCLRLSLGSQFYDNEVEIKKLLKQFISQEGKYSVQNIAQKAQRIFGLKPGDWYSPSQIAYVLCELQNQNKQSNLKMIVYDNQFEWWKTVQFLDQNQQRNQKIIKTTKIHLKDNILSTKINPGLIIILFRIGYKSPEQQLLKVVINLLKNERNCIGILGGRPGKAHYIFGTTEKSFVYLDPHCVKDNDQLDSFFCPSMFSVPHQNIDPSIGLCFFVRNTAELLRMYDHFQSFKKNLPFYTHTKGQIPLIVEKQEPQQKFQILQL